MEGSYKQFDQSIFDSEDWRARVAVMNALNEVDMYARPNDDKYGPDLMVYSGYKHKYYIEVEVKRVWKAGQDFPWDTVQIPERKLKFIQSTGRKLCEFWVLREDLKMAIIIPEEVLKVSPLVEVPNKLVATGEKFVQVPISECIIKEIG